MNKEEKQEKISLIETQIDDVKNKLFKDRSRLEEVYQDQLNKFNKAIAKNLDIIVEFNKQFAGFPEAVNKMFRNPNARFIDKYPNPESKMMGDYQELKNKYETYDRVLNEKVDELKRLYNDGDEQLVETATIATRDLESQLDELNDQYNEE